MKKVELKLDLHDDKGKQKAMKAVSGLPGIESIAINTKDGKLTVIGDVDPIDVVTKLRKKQWFCEILTVGPKEEKKGEDKKKEEEKKKDEEKKKEEDKKKDPVAELVKAYQAYNPYLTTHYHVMSAEENPNACVIC